MGRNLLCIDFFCTDWDVVKKVLLLLLLELPQTLFSIDTFLSDTS